MEELASRIIGLTSRVDYKPLTLKALARRLEIGETDYVEFRRVVKKLVAQGKLFSGKDKTFRPPDAKQGTVVGVFKRSSKGFGFVRPAPESGMTDQIFIPPDSGSDASTGDEVVVRVVKRPRARGENAEGRVIQVLSRSSGVFVGTYFERGGSSYVRCDGTTFSAPIFVGDPGAKGAREGDKVAIEMVIFPSPYREGEGVITEVLGPRGKPGVDTLTVIRALNIPDVFEDDALDEARRQARGFSEDSIGERLDVRERLTLTIDPATARDFDDAISLDRDDRGYWSLAVHIADVSHFVKAGGPLDESAKKRGTSVYLPDRVIPMLPEIISNSLASLQAGHVRFAVSAFLEFSPEGIRTDRSFARTAIKVDHRFTYEQVSEALAAPDAPIEGVGPELRALLERMRALAMILRGRRIERGALELNMPEVEVELGAEGEVSGAHLVAHDQSHQLIEEFMLAANEAVASFLSEKGVEFLRRAHPDPDPRKLREFAEFARGLGIPIENPESRFELQRVLAESARRPEAHAVHFALLRSLKQAIYTPEHEGHHALASEDYCHFTSPIRRYPDLQVHRRLLACLDGKKPKNDFDELVALGQHCTRTERRAEAAEREVIKIKLLTYLENRIGERYRAVIIHVEDFGLFVRLLEFPVEGLIHVTTFSDDYYYLERESHTLIGRSSGRRYRLGDELKVKVARVDVDRRELDLVLDVEKPLEPLAARPSGESAARPPSRRGKADRPSLPGPRKPTKKQRRKR